MTYSKKEKLKNFIGLKSSKESIDQEMIIMKASIKINKTTVRLTKDTIRKEENLRIIILVLMARFNQMKIKNMNQVIDNIEDLETNMVNNRVRESRITIRDTKREIQELRTIIASSNRVIKITMVLMNRTLIIKKQARVIQEKVMSSKQQENKYITKGRAK